MTSKFNKPKLADQNLRTLLFVALTLFGLISIVSMLLPYLNYWLAVLGYVDLYLSYKNIRIGRYAYVLLHNAVTSLPTVLWLGIREQATTFVLAGLTPLAAGLGGLWWTKPWQR